MTLAKPYGDGEPRPVPMEEPHRILFGRSAVLYSPARAFDPASFPSGGGGMVGTAPDFLVFLEALRTGGAPLLKPESVEALTTNAIGDLRVNAVGPGWGFGLGVAVLKDPVLAETPKSAGTWRWGGAYGHSLVRRSRPPAVGGGADQHRHRRHERAVPGWHPRCRLRRRALIVHSNHPSRCAGDTSP